MITFQNLAEYLEGKLRNPESEPSQPPINLDNKVILFFVEDNIDFLQSIWEMLNDYFKFKLKKRPEEYVVIVVPDRFTTTDHIRKVVSPTFLNSMFNMSSIGEIYCILDYDLSQLKGGDKDSGYEIARGISEAKNDNNLMRRVSIVGASSNSFPKISDESGNVIPLVDYDPTKNELGNFLTTLAESLVKKR